MQEMMSTILTSILGLWEGGDDPGPWHANEYLRGQIETFTECTVPQGWLGGDWKEAVAPVIEHHVRQLTTSQEVCTEAVSALLEDVTRLITRPNVPGQCHFCGCRQPDCSEHVNALDIVPGVLPGCYRVTAPEGAIWLEAGHSNLPTNVAVKVEFNTDGVTTAIWRDGADEPDADVWTPWEDHQ